MKYYKDNALFRFLRFLNLLEPENNILSISKLFMWMMLIILIYVLIVMPSHLDIILSAIGGVLAATMNYSYRRWIQYRREQTGENIDDQNDPIEDHSALTDHVRRFQKVDSPEDGGPSDTFR